MLCCRPDSYDIASRQEGGTGATLGLHIPYLVRSSMFGVD